MKLYQVIALLTLTSCGRQDNNEASGPANSLEGTKWFENLGESCAQAIKFSSDSQYSMATVCLTDAQGKTADIAKSTGTYAIGTDNKTLTLTTVKSSCEGKSPVTGTFTLSSTQFIFTTVKTHSFTPLVEAEGSGTMYTIGCFASNGDFTPSDFK